MRKTTASRVKTYMGVSGEFSVENLDIDGATDIGEASNDFRFNYRR